MTNNETILIVMPHFNEIDFIYETITSLLNQSYLNLELHIFDNASNDGSIQVIENLMNFDSRIVLHKNKINIGLINNYKLAYDYIIHSSFNYFVFVQGDDLFHPQLIEVLYNSLISKQNSSFSITSIATIDDFNQIKRYYPNFSKYNIKSRYIRLTKFILEPESLGKCHMFLGLVKTDDFRKIYNSRYISNNAFDYIIAFNLIYLSTPACDDRVLYFKRDSHASSKLNFNHFRYHFDFLLGNIPTIKYLIYFFVEYYRNSEGIFLKILLTPVIILKGYISIIGIFYKVLVFSFLRGIYVRVLTLCKLSRS